MKKGIITIIIILAISAQSNFAQDRKFNFGFKVAPAISWLSVDNANISSNGSSPKFNWGFIGEYNFNHNFAFVSGFDINTLGGKLKIDENLDGQEFTSNSTANYSEFEIPLIFQMKTDRIGHLKYYAQIGLTIAYVYSAKDDNNNDISNTSYPVNTGYILAAGIEYPVVGDVSFIGQIKYNGGLTSITKSLNYGTYSSNTNTNATTDFVELGFGILF
jgi:hypothetical protein